jgi:hypothetical protein
MVSARGYSNERRRNNSLTDAYWGGSRNGRWVHSADFTEKAMIIGGLTVFLLMLLAFMLWAISEYGDFQ